MRFEIITTTEKFKNLKKSWNALLISSGIKSVFLSWEWQYTWWEQYRDRLEQPELFIVIGYENEKPAVIFPGYIEYENKGNARSLFFLGSRFESTDYLNFISAVKNKSGTIEQICDFLLNTGRQIDIWRFINILEKDELLNVLAEYSKSKNFYSARHHHRICPYIKLSGTWEDFVNGLSKNMRYNLRRRTRNLFKKHNAQFIRLTKKAEIDKAIEILFDLHEKRFTMKEDKSIFQKELRHDFHKNVSRRLADADILRIFQIKIDSEIAATLYCFEFANEMMYFQAGFDPKWEKISVGLVLMGKCIEYSYQQKLEIFDFMRGAEDYKFKWTDTFRKMDLINIAVSPKGKSILKREETLIKIKDKVKSLIPDKAWVALKKTTGRV